MLIDSDKTTPPQQRRGRLAFPKQAFGTHRFGAFLALLFLCLAISQPGAAAQRSNPQAEFVQVHSGGFLVQYHPSDQNYANQVRSTLLRAADRLSNQFGIMSFEGSKLVIAWDSRHFEQLSGGGFPHWGAALARPDKKLIVMKSPRWAPVSRDPTGTVMHEMVHLATGMLTKGHAMPIWMVEGIAVEESGEIRGSAPISMATALSSGTLMNLWELDGLHGFSSEKAGLAYLQAESAVIYFKERYGRFSLLQLLLEVGRGTNFETAFDMVTAGGWFRFNEDYRKWVKKRFGHYLIQDVNSWIWGFILLLAIAAWGVKKMLAHKILKRWEEEDRMDPTLP